MRRPGRICLTRWGLFFAAQFTADPGAGINPVAVDGRARHAESLRGLLEAVRGEKAGRRRRIMIVDRNRKGGE
jgi:hypothetical protein